MINYMLTQWLFHLFIEFNCYIFDHSNIVKKALYGNFFLLILLLFGNRWGQRNFCSMNEAQSGDSFAHYSIRRIENVNLRLGLFLRVNEL